MAVVLLTGHIDDARLAEVRAIWPAADVRFCADDTALERQIGEAEVVLGVVPDEMLARAERLRWVHVWQAGPDRQLYPAMAESPVLLTSSKGNGAVPLAEHAVWLMLTLNRQAWRWIDAQRERRWERRFHGELLGGTVGIIGTGYCGSDLARKAKAFGMRVTGMRRQTVTAPGFDRIFAAEDRLDFLAECDFVVVTAPLTEETAGLLGEREFRAMKTTAHYVCVSRGGIADEQALLTALQQGWIAGAGLDAHTVEPLPEESPFWSLPNVLVTPHNGATTDQTMDRAYYIFRDNLRRYVAGEGLHNLVDKSAGY